MGVAFPLYAGFFVHFKSPQLKIFFIIGCIIAGFIVGGVAFMITKLTILKIVRKIALKMQNINNSGDLNNLLDKYGQKDELGMLISGFRNIVSDYKKINQAISDESAKTLSLGENLTADIGSTFNEIKIISESLEALRKNNNNQVESIKNNRDIFKKLDKIILLNLSNIVELVSNIDIFKTSISTQSEAVESILENFTIASEKLSGSGDGSIQATGKNMAGKTIDTLLQAENDISRIESSIVKIADISDQTGMLAINASIEAASQGERGSGFRVIATEIKRLAQDSAQTSAEISNTITEIRGKFKSNMVSIKILLGHFEDLLNSSRELIGAALNKQSGLRAQSEIVYANQQNMKSLLIQMEEDIKKLKDISGDTDKNLEIFFSGINAVSENVSSLDKSRQNIFRAENDSMEKVKEFQKAASGLKTLITENGE